MPELPEVEAARVLIEEYCCGKNVVEVNVAADPLVWGKTEPDELRKLLQGSAIAKANRCGKYLWLGLGDGALPHPLFHFGMGGFFEVKGRTPMKYKSSKSSEAGTWPPKNWKVVLQMEDGTQLAFAADDRRMSRIKLVGDPRGEEPLCSLGPDALLELPSESEWLSLLSSKQHRGKKAKALLMDQSFLAGCGNWVTDEVLYHARVHPEQRVGDLAPAAARRLRDSLAGVLRTAVDARADDSLFPRDWLFHYRWVNRRESSVDGKRIASVVVGGRTSYFVPELQKIEGRASGLVEEAGTAAGSRRGGAGGGGGKGSKRKGKQAAANGGEQEGGKEGEEEGGVKEEGKGASGGRGRKRAKHPGEEKVLPTAQPEAPAAKGRKVAAKLAPGRTAPAATSRQRGLRGGKARAPAVSLAKAAARHGRV